jgi:hypothetical protein
MVGKRSQAELKRLVQEAVADLCGLPRLGLWLCVDAVQVKGRPPERLRVWATLHFLPTEPPLCCGEPGCHLGLYGERLSEVADRVRRALNLRQPVRLEFVGGLAVNYHAGVRFSGNGSGA